MGLRYVSRPSIHISRICLSSRLLLRVSLHATLASEERPWGYGDSRKEPVRFDSFRFRFLSRKFVGSVQFGLVRKICFPVRRCSASVFLDALWLEPVHLGSVQRPVPAGSEIMRFCSVRFGRFGSVSYSFLLVDDCLQGHASTSNVPKALPAATLRHNV